jgi:hypothetical protein
VKRTRTDEQTGAGGCTTAETAADIAAEICSMRAAFGLFLGGMVKMRAGGKQVKRGRRQGREHAKRKGLFQKCVNVQEKKFILLLFGDLLVAWETPTTSTTHARGAHAQRFTELGNHTLFKNKQCTTQTREA